MKLRIARFALRLMAPLVMASLAIHSAAATFSPSAPPASLAAQPATNPDADRMLAQAKTTAAAQHKHILTVFSASWCGPCHMFERFLTDPTTGPIMNQAFIIVRLDVGEMPGDSRHADTPGAEKLMASLGGSQAGFPFIAMLNAQGKPIADSIRRDSHGPSGNVGYPTLLVEIDWFMHMLHEAAPSLSPQQTATIQTWLRSHAPQSHPSTSTAPKQTTT